VIAERQLIAQAQRGDAVAFEALVMTHAQFVHNLALRVVGNPQDAEDLAQEAFLRAWRALPGFRAEAKFSTWLYRIVTNLCYNHLPRLKKQLAELDPDEDALQLADERQSTETGLLSRELEQVLHNAVDALPESQRLLITLRHTQGLSYTEIAEITGQPLGTVKTGLFRARRALQTALERYENAHE